MYHPRVSPSPTVFTSGSAASRIEAAERWLLEHAAGGEVVLVGATLEAANELAQRFAHAHGAHFGWQRMTLRRAAACIAARRLAEEGKVVVGPLALEAQAARVAAHLGARLGRFERIADRPGLPRALARTVLELRLGGVAPEDVGDPEICAFYIEFVEALARAAFADAAHVLDTATRVLGDATERTVLDGTRGVLLLDVAVEHAVEGRFVRALAARARATCITVPRGDRRTAAMIGGVGSSALADDRHRDGPVDSGPPPAAPPSALARAQSALFAREAGAGGPATKRDVLMFSAPGESRECVEVARKVLEEVEAGVPFDRQAIVLRSSDTYSGHLREALGRAGIPAYFARGTTLPDPSGRAMVALLACAEEGLSATRFAEYLSLGELPEATPDGAPPAAVPRADRIVAADDEFLPEALAGDAEVEHAAFAEAEEIVTTSTPRVWERLITEALVIGTLERWERRLAGLERHIELAREALDEDSPYVGAKDRDLGALRALRRFALPLLGALDGLRGLRASWREWLDRLSALATSALRSPARVLSALAELEPLGDAASGADDVDLPAVRMALEDRLVTLVLRPRKRRAGCVYIAPIERVRGMSFHTVFVPGLAERMFPQKVAEDPILPDRSRPADHGLHTNLARADRERLYLGLAVGAATDKVVLSYPRIDVEQGRPRTPSFYALEILRVTEGRLPGFEELARTAEAVTHARIGWPAPRVARHAIDSAEHDLALLADILDRPEKEATGTARYLLQANPHLARALRFRGRRWLRKWCSADGLVEPSHPEARAALDRHLLGARSYSATALQTFAACPYRFVLYALLKLAPREEPAAIEEIDPLSRGSLVHEVEFEVLSTLREKGLLPLGMDRLEEARAILDETLARVEARYRDDLFPAIPRVWEDSIALVQADLREWLRRMTEEREWTPAYFELSFGLDEHTGGRDVNSRKEPVRLECGIALRGSVDLVEADASGALRATDYKTGKVAAKAGAVIGGGEILQPVLYALALEKLFPGRRVTGGRLYYCTTTGGFSTVEVPLDATSRGRADELRDAVEDALTRGFLPAAPREDACKWCDYRAVCGPYEQIRTRRKSPTEVKRLTDLRKAP